VGKETKIECATGVAVRDVPGFPGYRVDAGGAVYSAVRRVGLGRGKGTKVQIGDNWKALTPHLTASGYLCVNFGRGNTRVIHRLVLEAFVGPCPEGSECRHLNGDRTDNRLENLAWGTPAENHADQYQHGTREAGERHHWHKLTALQVKAIRDLYAAGKWNQYDLAALFGTSQPNVSSIVNKQHRVTDPAEAV
jgi:hypothetical protein